MQFKENAWADRTMDRRTDRKMDGRTEGWTDPILLDPSGYRQGSNIWNTLQFGCTYMSDFTAHTSSRYIISKSLFTDDRIRKITLVANSIIS